VAKHDEKIDSLTKETLRLDDQILAKLGDVGAGINHEAALNSDREQARVEKMGKRFVERSEGERSADSSSLC
jgi:hypothetical protein